MFLCEFYQIFKDTLSQNASRRLLLLLLSKNRPPTDKTSFYSQEAKLTPSDFYF